VSEDREDEKGTDGDEEAGDSGCGQRVKVEIKPQKSTMKRSNLVKRNLALMERSCLEMTRFRYISLYHILNN